MPVTHKKLAISEKDANVTFQSKSHYAHDNVEHQKIVLFLFRQAYVISKKSSIWNENCRSCILYSQVCDSDRVFVCVLRLYYFCLLNDDPFTIKSIHSYPSLTRQIRLNSFQSQFQYRISSKSIMNKIQTKNEETLSPTYEFIEQNLCKQRVISYNAST
jgi:hypothetical protein